MNMTIDALKQAATAENKTAFNEEPDPDEQAPKAGSWRAILYKEELDILDYIDGFMAADGGCVSSGIRHDTKREEIKYWMRDNPGRAFILFNAHTETYSTLPYGAEDAHHALHWLSEEYDCEW